MPIKQNALRTKSNRNRINVQRLKWRWIKINEKEKRTTQKKKHRYIYILNDTIVWKVSCKCIIFCMRSQRFGYIHYGMYAHNNLTLSRGEGICSILTLPNWQPVSADHRWSSAIYSLRSHIFLEHLMKTKRKQHRTGDLIIFVSIVWCNYKQVFGERCQQQKRWHLTRWHFKRFSSQNVPFRPVVMN